MKFLLTALLLLILLSAVKSGTESGPAEETAFGEIIIRGADSVPRGVLLSGSGIRQSGDKLLVDPDALDRVISQSPLVRSHTISVSEGKLYIHLEENPLLFTAVLKTARGNLFLEADENLKIRVKGYPVSANLPIIYIEESDYEDGGFSGRVREIAGILKRIKRDEPELYTEISELHMESGFVVVMVKGRRTEFLVNSSYGSFMRFKYILGYVDRSNDIFSKADIRGNPVLLR